MGGMWPVGCAWALGVWVLGAVRVWLEISRSGQVLGVGVMSSSGSNLLDGEALKTLKNGFYPAFPDEAYVGESAHKFSATLSYTLEAQ